MGVDLREDTVTVVEGSCHFGGGRGWGHYMHGTLVPNVVPSNVTRSDP